jgi:ribosomal protein S9
MKPTPNTKAFRNFTAAMQRILTVSKTELLDREKRAKETRKAKRASARASREKG